MACSNTEHTGFKYLRDIQEAAHQKDYISMTDKINNMTKYLFSNSELIYSELNDEFERSGLMQTLFECIDSLNEQSRRDIMRLLNIFLKTNNNLRNHTPTCLNYLHFLLKRLNNKDSWNNVEKIKYYVNLSSYLLLNKNVKTDTESVRNIVGQILLEPKNDDNLSKKIMYMMFYSSAAINASLGNFETIPQQNNEHYNHQIMNKEIINNFVELIRDYIHDFKVFYDNPTSEKSKYNKYNLKAEYSFDQICQCLIYYAQTNEKVRSNIFQSGLYDLLSLIFLIKWVPENFLLNAMDIFLIPCMDTQLKERFRTENTVIIDKLKGLRLHNSNLIKENLDKLLNKYECINSSLPKRLSNQFSQTEMLITLPNPGSKYSSRGTDNWGSLDVDHWLSENNLEACRKNMSSLTGRGLSQLKSLMKDSNGKFQLIELLISKLNIDLVSVLEFLGALESFNNE